MWKESHRAFVKFLTDAKLELLCSLIGGSTLLILYSCNHNTVQKEYWYSDGWLCETRTHDNNLSKCRSYNGVAGQYTVDTIYNASNIRMVKQ